MRIIDALLPQLRGSVQCSHVGLNLIFLLGHGLHMSGIIAHGFDPYELIELLERRGVSHPAALVLVCLLVKGPNDSSGLQNSCGIRQPEVSIGIAELRGLGILGIEAVRRNGRGRPRHLYSLCGGIDETLEPILLRARKKLDNLTLQIGKLEEIAAGSS
ncbi:MAG: hypothetical protein CXX80_07475 [Methanobacteriota archaeon]|nr:MAG: hypothetical protein CXX80_12565 [Euryarchaeota archaeon]PXY74278.1 MAG: hypothetical protein CXX80_07475 [Euryarchaeota archaeon]